MNNHRLQKLSTGLLATVLVFGLAITAHAGEANHAEAESTLTQAEKQKLQKLILDLKSNDPETLHIALQKIGRMESKAADAVEPLSGMLMDDRKLTYPSGNILGHESFQVNLAATMALRNIGKPAVESLVTALGNKDNKVRLQAAQALVAIGQPIESKHWIQALSNSNRYVQIIAAQQLGKMKDVSGVEALCKAMEDKDKDAEVRIEIAKILGHLGDTRAIEPLIAALPHANSFNAAVAASCALAQIGEPALEVLLNRFEGFDEPTRDLAAIAFQYSDGTRLKVLLLRCCNSEYSQIREGALNALIKNKMPETYAMANRMVEDPVWKVRWTAVRGLGEFADKETNNTIRTLLLKVLREDKHPKVRERALQSLYALPGIPPDSSWQSIGAALDDESPIVRKAAMENIGKCWDPRLTPKLSHLLKDSDPTVRAAAAGCLAYFHIESATADLIELLKDKAPECAERSALALGYLGTNNAVMALIETMQNCELDPKLRNAAVHGLCVSKNRKAIDPLIDSLKDKSLRPSFNLTQKTLKELTGQDFRRPRDWLEWKEQRKTQEP